MTVLTSSEVYFDMTSKEINEGYVLDFREACEASLGIIETTEEEYKEINTSNF